LKRQPFADLAKFAFIAMVPLAATERQTSGLVQRLGWQVLEQPFNDEF
jgi:hypothetical protein